MATVIASCQCPCSFTAAAVVSSRSITPDSSIVSGTPFSASGSPPSATTTSSAAAAACCHSHQTQLNSPPLSVPLHPPSRRRGRTLLPCPRAAFDSDTILAVGVGVAGIALGIGIPIFYETQVKGSEGRENNQPCFPCKGTGSQICRFCIGAGDITVELGGGEKEVSKCINCEGAGTITCNNCQGSGIQPRYLDRREYKDED